MSIRDAINALDGDQIWLLPSEFLGAETPRTVYVSREVADFVCAEPSDTRDGRMAATARAVLDDFTEGGWITVGEDPFDKRGTCIMARVSPVQAEIFDFRCLDPNPGVRILGAFAEPDTFIALIWDYRENFDGSWPQQIARAQAVWNRLFPGVEPFQGKQINEYITYNVEAC